MCFIGVITVVCLVLYWCNNLEQVNSFNYLGNIISYEKELDIDNKLHNYLKITGTLTL